MTIIQLLGFVADAQGEYKSRPAIHMDAFRSLFYIIIIIIIIILFCHIWEVLISNTCFLTLFYYIVSLDGWKETATSLSEVKTWRLPLK